MNLSEQFITDMTSENVGHVIIQAYVLLPERVRHDDGGRARLWHRGEAEYVDGTRMCYFNTEQPGGVYFQAHEIAQGSRLKQNLQPDSPQ